MNYLDMAEDVQALIEREGLDRPAVVGHSMGGKTAMALALLHPASVARLVVVDIAPVAYSGDRFSPYVQAMSSIDTLAASSRSEVQRRLGEAIPDSGVVGFLMQNLVMRNDHFDWRLNLAGLGASLQALGDFPAPLLARRYEGPVTVIAGALSDYVKPADRGRCFPG
jgi:pimeloyl-ACP methyl ester carboxylesterase